MAAQLLKDLDFGLRTAIAKYLGRSQCGRDFVWALALITVKIGIYGIKDITVSLNVS